MLTVTRPVPFLHATRCPRSVEQLRAELKERRKAVLMDMLKALGRLALIATIWLAIIWVFVVVLSIVAHGVFAVFGGGLIGQAVVGLCTCGVIYAFAKLTTPARY